jgi:hypothetical protein
VRFEVIADSCDVAGSDCFDFEMSTMFDDGFSDAGIDAERADCCRRSFRMAVRC